MQLLSNRDFMLPLLPWIKLPVQFRGGCPSCSTNVPMGSGAVANNNWCGRWLRVGDFTARASRPGCPTRRSAGQSSGNQRPALPRPGCVRQRSAPGQGLRVAPLLSAMSRSLSTPVAATRISVPRTAISARSVSSSCVRQARLPCGPFQFRV